MHLKIANPATENDSLSIMVVGYLYESFGKNIKHSIDAWYGII